MIQERKQLSTPINSILFDEFKTACDKDGLKLNTVIEAMMIAYIDGYIKLVNTREGIRVDTSKIKGGVISGND